jgi:predicted ester cyclase
VPQAAEPSEPLKPPRTAGIGDADPFPDGETRLERQLMDLGIPAEAGPEERNRALVLRMVTLMNAGDVDGYVAHFAERFINHGFTVRREDARVIIQDIKDTFPDIRFEPTHVFVRGEWVTLRMWFSGTHRGMSRFPVNGGVLLGVPPTERPCRVEHIHLLRIRDGQILEHYACRDDVEMARQLGVLPALPPIPGMPPRPDMSVEEEREVSLAA